MRILTVGNRYPPVSSGGYERLWTAAVAALRADGHRVHVLTTADPADGEPGPEVSRTLRWYWRDGSFPPVTPRVVAAVERANVASFAQARATTAPDVVIWFAMGGMSLSLLGQARAAGLPQLAIIADDWLSYGPRVDGLTRRLPGPLRHPIGCALTRALGAGPGPGLRPQPRLRVSFISAFLRDAAAAGGAWEAPASVDHPGVDAVRFAAVPPGPWRGRLLYCGRLDERKGVSVALRALAALPEATLTVDGSGTEAEMAGLRTLAERTGVAARVRWQQSEPSALPGVYGAADAVLFPVRWAEPWGLVPLEAMAIGRPVIAARSGGGAAEYLTPGDNALTVTPGDATALAGAVGRLATDPVLRARLIAGGHATAAAYTQTAWLAALRAHLAAVTA